MTSLLSGPHWSLSWHNSIYKLSILPLFSLSVLCFDKKMQQESRVELTPGCSVKLLAECVGDIVPECVENIRLAILQWKHIRHWWRPFKLKMSQTCTGRFFFLLKNWKKKWSDRGQGRKSEAEQHISHFTRRTWKCEKSFSVQQLQILAILCVSGQKERWGPRDNRAQLNWTWEHVSSIQGCQLVVTLHLHSSQSEIFGRFRIFIRVKALNWVSLTTFNEATVHSTWKKVIHAQCTALWEERSPAFTHVIRSPTHTSISG